MAEFCRTCFLRTGSADAQWLECFVSYVPSALKSADVARLLNQELLAASATLERHTVVSVHLSSSHAVDATQFGFVRFSTHDAACYITWRMNGYRFPDTAHVLYIVPHKDSDQRSFYLSLLQESQQVVRHLSDMQQLSTLRSTVLRQLQVVDAQALEIAELKRRVFQLEKTLCQTQKCLSPPVAAGKAVVLLPRALKEND